MIKRGMFKYLSLIILAAGLPACAAVHYSFSVGTGVGSPVIMTDPFIYGGFYSPYYMFNRPYYRNYLYYGGGANFMPPPPAMPVPVIKHRKPNIHLHRIHKNPR